MHYLELISQRQILPDVVRSYERKTYKVRIPGSEITGWPDGLRIFFRVERGSMTVVVIDMGDHETCATHPDQSVYPDER